MRLLHPHDVRACLRTSGRRRSRSASSSDDLDAVEEEPLDEPVRLSVAALARTERDDVRLGVLAHPVVRDVERRRAAGRPRSAGHAAAVDLELVLHQVLPIRNVELQRRPRDRVLRRPRAEPAAREDERRAGHAAAGPGPVAHLDRGAVETDELQVHRRVERAPVVPALGDSRARRAAAGQMPGRGGGSRSSTSR